MEYLRTTTYNRITGMNMSGVCINYDNFWNDVRMTADCEFDKDEYSPTERYHNRLVEIMKNVWSGKKRLPVVFSIRLEKYISLVDYPVCYTFAVIDKDFSSGINVKRKFPKKF